MAMDKPMRASWAKIANNENSGEEVIILPAPTESVHGNIKTVTQFRQETDEKGETKYYRVVDCYEMVPVRKRISKNAILRRNLPKFGRCADVGPGPEKGITTPCPDFIPIEWVGDGEEDEEENDNPMADLFKKSETQTLFESFLPKHLVDQTKKQAAGTKKLAPNPFGPRKFRSTEEMEDTPTIRILDIPRSATFQDLLTLVSGFRSKRIKLPRDQMNTDHNRGFAFVTFDEYRDAKVAKNTLHGHAYGTNILHCEWSRNYLNYLKANPGVQKKLETGNTRSTRRRFINSSRKG